MDGLWLFFPQERHSSCHALKRSQQTLHTVSIIAILTVILLFCDFDIQFDGMELQVYIEDPMETINSRFGGTK
jgi:hypothetical protein